MSVVGGQKDLVVLVADGTMKNALMGILNRPESIGIRTITFQIYPHHRHDPGCLLESHDFLSRLAGQFRHALVVFDKEGCGRESCSRGGLEAEVSLRLSESGWGERAQALVIDPELEAWVWSDSPHVESVLGWQGQNCSLSSWLKDRGYLEHESVKPQKPKEAMKEVLRLVKKPFSSAIHRELAEKVSLERCQDAAFQRLKTLLRQWFPPLPSV
ncbi:MAG TPA: hypothetical protein VMZ06_16650 [Candidatus Bathyarchaeia archaeon]|nr:hypothetical protein [Candidatus Bathyarchaeia archaeon]